MFMYFACLYQTLLKVLKSEHLSLSSSEGTTQNLLWCD